MLERLTMSRKTGIILKDTGIRDEHGMEPIDGIFSSPEKPSSSRKTNGSGNATLTETDMDTASSNTVASQYHKS